MPNSKVLIVILLLASWSCTPSKSKEEAFPVGQISTPKGDMLFWLYDETPNHKASFIKLANEKYWDILTFNRVIEGFVIQGGCPDTSEGFADSPYLIAPEFNEKIKHSYGALGAGRDNNPDKLSAGCQLYIVDNEEGIARLDGEYMIFGQMFKGFDVLDAIAKVPTDSTDQPLEDIPMKVEVVNLTLSELNDLGYK